MIGDGEPALIIHGAGGGFDQAIDIAGVLAGRGYRLIAPSRFGYLGSPLPTDLVTTMQADAYAELLDRLGVSRAFVIAISAGAWSAMQFAIRHPQRCRALVLLVPADYLPPRMPNHGGALFRAIIASDFVAWAALKVMWLVPGAMARDDARHGAPPRPHRRAERKGAGTRGSRSPPAGELTHQGDGVRYQDRRRDRPVSDREDFLPGPDRQRRGRSVRHGCQGQTDRRHRAERQGGDLSDRRSCLGWPLLRSLERDRIVPLRGFWCSTPKRFIAARVKKPVGVVFLR